MIQQRKNIKSHHWSSCDVHFPKDVVKHSGDVMNFAAKQGRHEIDLDLDLLPDRVTDVARDLFCEEVSTIFFCVFVRHISHQDKITYRPESL